MAQIKQKDNHVKNNDSESAYNNNIDAWMQLP